MGAIKLKAEESAEKTIAQSHGYMVAIKLKAEESAEKTIAQSHGYMGAIKLKAEEPTEKTRKFTRAPNNTLVVKKS